MKPKRRKVKSLLQYDLKDDCKTFETKYGKVVYTENHVDSYPGCIYQIKPKRPKNK